MFLQRELFNTHVTWADPELFKRRGRTSIGKKKMPKGVYDVCLGARCFLYACTYVWYDFFHSQMEVRYVCVCVCVLGGGVEGHDFCTRKSWVTIVLLVSMKWGSGGPLPEKF